MDHRGELMLLQKVMQKMHIRTVLSRRDELDDPRVDLGFRQFAVRQEEYLRELHEFAENLRPNILYVVRDTMRCNYFLLLLPQPEDVCLVVGPYMNFHMTREQLLAEAERFGAPPHLFPQIERFYGGIPVVDEHQPLALMMAFAEIIWEGAQNYTIETLERDVVTLLTPLEGESAPRQPEVTLMDMEMLERRYAWEREMMEQIARGQAWAVTEQLRASMAGIVEMTLERRASDPLRNLKNYGVVMNTIARKAA